MPTYEYECPQCAHSFEAFQSMTDKPLRKCPECGSRRLRRLIGAGAGILFKGSGFHSTDYRSKSYAESAKADKPKPAAKECPAKAAGKCPAADKCGAS